MAYPCRDVHQQSRRRDARAREKTFGGQKLQSAPLISTFHSLCVRILRADIEALGEGYTRSFTIYDTDDSSKVVKQCGKRTGP